MTLHVTSAGCGPDLVLLHGWGLNSACWGTFAEELAREFRVHRIDLPGHGRSPWNLCAGGKRAELDDWVEDVRSSVPRGATVVGWSLGATVALRLAVRAPARVGRLALIAATPKFTAGATWTAGLPECELMQFARQLTTEPGRAVQRFLALQVRGDPNPITVLRELRRRLDMGGAPQSEALAAGFGLLRDSDLRSEVATIVQPLLVICGEYDRITPPAAATALARAVVDGRVYTIPGAAHAPFLSHPGECLAAARAFLAGSTTTAALRVGP